MPRSSSGKAEIAWVIESWKSGRFKVNEYGVKRLIAKLGLIVTQQVAYKVTTKRKHSDAVADDPLETEF